MAKTTDPRITLLDTAVAALPLRPACAEVWARRVNARRYIFDLGASERIGEMMRDCVDLMVDNIEFARTPYPTCYFEFDSTAMWRGWRPEQPAQLETRDTRVGYLVHDGSVIVIATGTRPNTHRDKSLPTDLVCGMSFRINRPQSQPYSKLTGLPDHLAEQVKNGYVFGGQRGYDKPGDAAFDHFDERTWVFLPELPGAWTHTQVSAHFDVMPALQNTPPAMMTKMSFLGGGDPLTLTTMLLLLNQPTKYVGLTTMEGRRGIYKGKLKSFKEHHVVSLHLDKSQHVRRMFHVSDRASPIMHDVGGHWKHYNKSEWCNHHKEDGRQAWEPVGPELTEGGDFKRYWCALCLQRRTWVEKFERGDAERGVTTKDYHVHR